MKLLFGPYIKENPYQKQLVDCLKNLNIEIKDITKVFFKQSLLGTWKPDVLHLHWLHAFFITDRFFLSVAKLSFFILKISVLKLLNVKIVWTVHNINNHEKKYLFLDKVCTHFVANIADSIIVHSQSSKKKLLENIGIKNKEKVFIVPHGNYIEYYQNNIEQASARKQLDSIKTDFVFLFIGAIRPYKGVDELIDNFKQLTAENLRLVIVGNPINEEYSQLIESKVNDDRAIKYIPGYVPEEQIQLYLNACDVVVFPYKDILTSGSVLLAMSFGKPCIVPYLGCIGEILDEKGAFFFNPQEQNSLLSALEKAIEQQDNLPQMGEHSLELARKYNWQDIAEKTLNIYQHSLNC